MRKTKQPEQLEPSAREQKVTARIAELEKAFDGVGDALVVVRPLIIQQARIESDIENLQRIAHRSETARTLYNRRLSQLINISKALTGILRKDGAEEESPLRAYLAKLAEEDGGADD